MIKNDFDYFSFKPVIVGDEDWPEDINYMVEWCRTHCGGRWAYGLHHGDGGVIVSAFYFENTFDYTGFSLTWGL